MRLIFGILGVGPVSRRSICVNPRAEGVKHNKLEEAVPTRNPKHFGCSPKCQSTYIGRTLASDMIPKELIQEQSPMP